MTPLDILEAMPSKEYPFNMSDPVVVFWPQATNVPPVALTFFISFDDIKKATCTMARRLKKRKRNERFDGASESICSEVVVTPEEEAGH